MLTIFFTALGFFLGSLPLSVWIGRFGLGKDIRQFGDGNPGATNVLRAGGFLWFSLALLLDISKGALPLGLATHIVGLTGWEAVPIALAPVVGHAFSPFLNWNGGKAIAAAFGVWIGLTLWQMPLLSLLLLSVLSLLIRPSGWAVLLTLLGMLLGLIFWLQEPVLLSVWATQTALLSYTHRHDLVKRPQRRPLPNFLKS